MGAIYLCPAPLVRDTGLEGAGCTWNRKGLARPGSDENSDSGAALRRKNGHPHREDFVNNQEGDLGHPPEKGVPPEKSIFVMARYDENSLISGEFKGSTSRGRPRDPKWAVRSGEDTVYAR